MASVVIVIAIIVAITAAVVSGVVAGVISGVAPAVIAVTRIVVGDRITDDPGGGDACKRKAGIDGLNGATV